jgi:hypothetical protein
MAMSVMLLWKTGDLDWPVDTELSRGAQSGIDPTGVAQGAGKPGHKCGL